MTPEAKEDMRVMYFDGNTLADIAEKYLITRQYVYQILKKINCETNIGGAKLRGIRRAVKKKSDSDAFWIEKYGLKRDEIVKYQKLKITHAYARQRQNAKRREVKFNLKFSDWISIWIASGYLELRGIGKGHYVMSRYEDKGAYEIGNVFIQLADENNREYANRKHAKIKA